MLYLQFTPPDERYVQESYANVFDLYEDRGHYPLPNAVLGTEPGVPEVELQEIRVLPAGNSPFDQKIAASWDSHARLAGEWVVGERAVSTGISLLADEVGGAGPNDGRPAEAVLRWRWTYTDPHGVTVPQESIVQLRFAPRGVVPPEPVRRPVRDAVAERLGVPAALRQPERDESKKYKGFIAVDFGTSSSTVTLLDTRKVVQRALDPAQLARLRERLAALLQAEPPEALAGEWRVQRAKLVSGVASRLKSSGPADHTALIRLLRGPVSGDKGGGYTDPLVDAVCLGLDERLAECGERLAAWLAPRVLDCYDQAFQVPNLSELSIRPVILDGVLPELESVVTVVEKKPVAIRMGVDEGETFPGVKTFLNQPRELRGMTGQDGRPATTDDLIARVYRELVERAEKFAREEPDQPEQRITDVVVTFPTTTPPAARLRLKRLVEHCLGLDRVVMEYDEGVAAGLFFLMRDFGSDRTEIGAEALIARSHRVSDDPPTWTQNMLIIDIGAGTTDIALLRLTISDITVPVPEVDELVQGRYYLIKPEVRNSTGHPQLGGNYLTLRIFYWLKAAIVDALARGNGEQHRQITELVRQSIQEPGGQSLASLAVEHEEDKPVPRELAVTLRNLLPTDWNVDDQDVENRREAFSQLWRVAEETKIAMASSEDDVHTIPVDELRPFFNALKDIETPVPDISADLLPPEGIRLDRRGFVRIARQVLGEAVAMSNWLIRATLVHKDEDGEERQEPLDRVMLSGKTSKMPLLRQVVVEELAGKDGSGGRLNWNPAAITVEHAYAKQAASLGACWAQSIAERQRGVEDSAPERARGRTEVAVDVGNLFNALPCGFELKRHGRQSEMLLRAGDPLVERDDMGTVSARSAWHTLLPTHEIHRPVREGTTVQWGTFKYFNRKEKNFIPDPRIWSPSSDGQEASKIKVQLEITPDLMPYLFISHGRPHYFVGPADGDTVSLREEFADHWSDEDGGRLRAMPAAVVVAAVAEDGTEVERRTIFPAWSPEQCPVEQWFREFFHERPDLEGASSAVRGRVSTEQLPPLPPRGRYDFLLVWPAAAGGPGQETPLPPLPTPAAHSPHTRYTMSLDIRGTLRVHRGEPLYWKANSLYEVERYPGSVLRIEMDKELTTLDPDWDPFSGRH